MPISRDHGRARVVDLTGAMIDEPPMETFAAAAVPVGGGGRR
jgi:hypothetical protein